MTLLRLTLSDLLADRRRTALTILAIAPLVAASLILLAVADGLRGVGEAGPGQDLVLAAPNVLDPASARLDPEVLDIATEVGGADVVQVDPMIFRTVVVTDRVFQLRAAPRSTWESVHGLSLLTGAWPGPDDEIAITEGTADAAGWRVDDDIQVFGTTFTVTALVRARGTKFSSIWMHLERAEALFENTSFQMAIVRVSPTADPTAVRDRLQAAAGGRFVLYFANEFVAEQDTRLDSVADLALLATAISLVALTFAAATLAERSRDAAIVRTLGFGRRAITAFALTRSVSTTAAGYIVGAAAAAIFLGSREPTSLRSFIIEVPLGPGTLAWGLLLGIGASIVGAWATVRRAARRNIHDLLGAT